MINATNDAPKRELLPAGTYSARCYSMVHLGNITEEILGEKKTLNKVRISWELPEELKIFKEGEPAKPLVISEEYNLSMNEKATLRKLLEAWRGVPFTEAEVKSFDVSKLLGVACIITVIHKETAKGGKYAKVASVGKIMKGQVVPPQINPSFLLSYENFDVEKFKTLPDFIRKKIESSQEFKVLANDIQNEAALVASLNSDNDDLPF